MVLRDHQESIVLRDDDWRLKAQVASCLLTAGAFLGGAIAVGGNLSHPPHDVPVGATYAALALFSVGAALFLFLTIRTVMLRLVIGPEVVHKVGYWWTVNIRRSDIAGIDVSDRATKLGCHGVYIVLKNGKRVLASAITDSPRTTGSEDLRCALGVARVGQPW